MLNGSFGKVIKENCNTGTGIEHHNNLINYSTGTVIKGLDASASVVILTVPLLVGISQY